LYLIAFAWRGYRSNSPESESEFNYSERQAYLFRQFPNTTLAIVVDHRAFLRSATATACVHPVLHLPVRLGSQTFVWTRGAAFPVAQLATRLKCPSCGSRRVALVFHMPREPRETSGRSRPFFLGELTKFTHLTELVCCLVLSHHLWQGVARELFQRR
jgi:hypothetical protein